MSSIEKTHTTKRYGKRNMILAIIAVLVIAEISGLIWLKWSVNNYHSYWMKRAESTGEITYLALGDSAAQGIGASSPSRGYAGLIAKRLEKQTGKKVRVINLSKTGATIQDYLKEQAPKITDIKADYVTIEIGANDIANFNAETFRSDFKKALSTLPPGTYVSNMPLFNSRPGRTAHGKQASEIIVQELARYPQLKFVDLQKQTSEHQSIFGFAPDLFHPNNLSYKNWADAFWLAIEKNNFK